MILNDRRIDLLIHDCNDASDAEILILDRYKDVPFVKAAFKVIRVAREH